VKRRLSKAACPRDASLPAEAVSSKVFSLQGCVVALRRNGSVKKRLSKPASPRHASLPAEAVSGKVFSLQGCVAAVRREGGNNE